jgi:uncharacterized membrane protein YfcA
MLEGAVQFVTAQLGFSAMSLVAVLIVLFASGIVSGLAGFAFSAIAASVLWLLPPLKAMPLIMVLSLCNMVMSFVRLGIQVRFLPDGNEAEGALPYIVGGLIGVPLGIHILGASTPAVFSIVLGGFLFVYSVFSALRAEGRSLAMGGWKPAFAVGAVGGVVGGFSGFPGSAPLVYLDMIGVKKADVRSLSQPYIMAMQVVSLAMLAVTRPAVFDAGFWLLFLVSLPVVLLGTNLGVGLYRRLSDVAFKKAVLVLLMVSGSSLVAKALLMPH